MTSLLLHFDPGQRTTDTAFAAEAARTPSGAVIVNPNNPASATSFTWGGANWQFQPGSNDGYGNWHLTRDNVGTGYLFQIVTAGSNLYGYNLKTTTWYRWLGSSWSQVGSAPPFVSGKAVRFLLGASCCSAHGSELPWTKWLGRIPDYDDNGSGSGTAADFVPGVNTSGWSNAKGGGGQLPGDLAYAMVSQDANGHCIDPNGQTYGSLDTVLQAIAAGNYDSAINFQIQNYLVPIASELYFIRISHEWPGPWVCDSPWYGSSDQSPNIPPSDWIAAWRHVHDLLKAKLPNVKYEWDGPYDATQASYYPGDSYVDLIGEDIYIGDGQTNDSQALANWAGAMTGTWGNVSQGGQNISYLLQFMQQHNKPFVVPEWADMAQYSSSSSTGNPIITQFANLFASLSFGPGNAVLVAQSIWDNEAACSGCGLGDYAGKKTAYGQAWPNGFANTHYNGNYWQTPLIPMPAYNFWD
jgi:Glycosyl hydrolase family 26